MADSAFMGSPPNTEQDFYIVKGLWHALNKYNVDASKGYTIVKRPADAVYENKKAGVIVALVLTLLLQVSVTALRLSLRFFRRRMSWGLDDWTIIPGVLMAMVCQIMQILMVTKGGGGEHIWDVTYAQYRIFTLYSVIYKLLFYVGVGIVKVSITFFNLRLTALSSRAWRVANYVFLGMLVVYIFLAFFWVTFQCHPASFSFDREFAGRVTEPAKCSSTLLVAMVLSIIHTTMDFLLLLTPVIVIWKVQMPRGDKIRLIVLFSMGSLSCIASIGRIRAIQNSPKDMTWQWTTLLAWNTVDLTVSVLVASLPVLNVLFHRSLRSDSDDDTNVETNFDFPSLASTAAAPQSRNSHVAGIPLPKDDTEEHEFIRDDSVQLAYVSNQHGGDSESQFSRPTT